MCVVVTAVPNVIDAVVAAGVVMGCLCGVTALASGVTGDILAAAVTAVLKPVRLIIQ